MNRGERGRQKNRNGYAARPVADQTGGADPYITTTQGTQESRYTSAYTHINTALVQHYGLPQEVGLEWVCVHNSSQPHLYPQVSLLISTK